MRQHPVFQLVLTEFRSFWREPAVLFWSLVFPMAIAGALGLGFMNRTEPLRKIAVAGAQVPATLLELGRYTDLREEMLRPRFQVLRLSLVEAQMKLKRGEISLYVSTDSSGAAIFHFDPANAEAKETYTLLENELLKLHAQGPRIGVQPVQTKGYRYIDFLVPGLITFGIMNSCIWGIGWNLVDYRVRKLLRRMAATPMRKTHFMLAQMIARVSLGLVETAFLLLFAHWAFGVQVQGSWAAFALVYAAGVWAFSGMAVLLASRVEKLQVANGLVNAITLPMTVLSGIFFSYQGFPDWALALIKWLPLTALTDQVRAIFNEGAGLAQALPTVGALGAFGLALFALGLRWFKWY